MKISVNDQEIFTLSDFEKKVIQSELDSSVFDAEIKRRLQWIIMEKYNEALKNLKAKWEPILINRGATSLPVKLEEIAKLIFDQPDYKDARTRIIEAEEARKIQKK